jgi:hypothetical protein
MHQGEELIQVGILGGGTWGEQNSRFSNATPT